MLSPTPDSLSGGYAPSEPARPKSANRQHGTGERSSTRSPSARVNDPWARNVYIDTFNSDYGDGWRHDTAITTHARNGGFCYTFVPQAPPKGYPEATPNGNGLGERYRITVMGPGVTPIVQWEGTRLTKYDADAQSEAAKRFEQILGDDKHCAPERSSGQTD